ncbi:PREDICTED: uncharacterized protein LOC106332709 isoform X5 [Brassica oleracea var. oleracea]|uniref:uncharacterized protein LOC106332709 isoform X5 n=1 Tax=Brassica oleracea var. oleracea TaxID=109376 RepID=UPI0006A704BD|nr:PREDICTED: uncharacterized protein LOC106332709 isoform X5 [Brassica oleracea var. oleracea]
MASSSRKDYEIISDPFDPRCVVACFIRLQRQTDKEKLLLERIRGKEDSTSQKYTDQEERSLINEQISCFYFCLNKGFDVDFSMFRCLFNFYPLFLDENNSTLIRETDRQFFGRLAQESIAAYNIREGTSFEFVEVEKANLYRNKGEIEHSFCRLKPGQQECKEDSKRVVKKPRYNTRSNKRACRCH